MKTTIVICVVVLTAIIGFAALGGKANYPDHDLNKATSPASIPQ